MLPAMSPRDLSNELIAHADDCKRNPLLFVQVAFPWGEAGSEFAQHAGPRAWQRQVLGEIGARLRAAHEPGAVLMPVLKALATGHGVGKSAMLAWLILWALSTMPDGRVVVTAGTEGQLRTKTWPELARWARMSLFSSWFDLQGTSILSADPARSRTWRADAVTWSEVNTEAFQGLHNFGRRILIVFDEASAISDPVWTAAEGVLSDENTKILWLVCGNPTRPTGAFFRCFHAHRDRWHGQQIDASTVEGVNVRQIEQWAEMHGRDSDFFRIRVLGEFPLIGDLQFIGADAVEAAAHRDVVPDAHAPVVLGVDVARFGDDVTCICPRKGRDARTLPWTKLRRADTMTVASAVAELAQRYGAVAIHVDGGGVGGGVVDRLRQIGLQNIRDVQFGARSDAGYIAADRVRTYNKRSELWATMREWLAGGAIPDDAELKQDITGPRYGFRLRDGQDAILLEPKAEMKVRGLASPDAADALALTFAYPAPLAVPRAAHRLALDFPYGWPSHLEDAPNRGAFADDYHPYTMEAET